MSQNKPCFKFAEGKCTYGAKCKFSHSEALKSGDTQINTPGESNAGLNPASSRLGGSQVQAKYDSEFRNWRYMIPRAPYEQSRPLGFNGLSRFFGLAFDMVSAGDPSTTQQVITSLSSEGGLSRVVELTEIPLGDLPVSSKLRSFEEVYLPFLRLITHEDVLSSLVLEVHVGTIFAVLYGNHGQRAVPMFKSLAGVLFALKFNDLYGENNLDPVSVRSTLTALAKIIELNQSACVNESFRDIAETLTNCIGGRDEEGMTDIDMQGAFRSLEKIRARLGLGSLMPLGWDTSVKAKPAKAVPMFELEQDMPGHLLAGGPRHDNDHEDIFAIKVMPTAQEIQSQCQEYLPVNDPQRLHRTGMGGLLDRHFRLLREDTIGQLRDAVRQVIEQLRVPERGTSRIERRGLGARVFLYQGVSLTDFKFELKSGLHVLVEFDQPSEVRKLQKQKQRAEFWSDSKQLQVDSLLCLVDSDGRTTFLRVSERNSNYKGNKDTALDATLDSKVYSLWNNRARAAVAVQPVESEIEQLIQRSESQNRVRQVLVEFPGVLLPSFRPTLQALQQMSRQHEIPFSALLAPPYNNQLGSMRFPPPAYSLQSGFSFDLSSITGGANLSLSPRERFNIQNLKRHSSLDDAQCAALVHGLTNGLALIQGPPGTGKSYVGVEMVKVLLANREVAELGPIICVCYTNHALDQILEHLIRDGVNQVIRLGSQSKSEVLESCTLIAVSREMGRTKIEKQQNWELQRRLESDSDSVCELLKELGNVRSYVTIKKHLELHHNKHYRQLFGDSEEGWTTVHHKPENIIDDWLRGRGPRASLSPSGPRPIGSLLNESLFQLSSEERTNLFHHWITDIKNELVGNLLIASEDYVNTKNGLDKCRKEIQLRCLQQADIIGATTTGLAKNLDILRRLPSKVLLCEEAGEVLEAHILTALLPSIEHCILIGDHEQLRPQIQNFDLSLENPRGRKYSLDVSLFERLVRPSPPDQIRVPFSTLEIQRRMHPSIADLVRQTLYPRLKDHPSVAEFPQVSGIRRRLFWLDHREKEAGADATQPNQVSHWNSYEVEMVAALVSHLVRQGTYKSEEIAVITPYLLQLRKIRKRLSSAFEIVVGDRDLEDLEKEGLDEAGTGQTAQPTARKVTLLNALRVATVDNFQGEEANVIVVSLVRSNDEKRCGFLKTSNRINVLLSRARHGMYIIGNADTSRHVLMWEKVISILQRNGNIGPKLPLSCQRHPGTAIEVSTPDDFLRLAPEGGCSLQCEWRLECGHSCPNKCHSRPLHKAATCLEPCPRSRKGCDHACPKHCGQDCDELCTIIVKEVTLPCGHVAKRPKCHEAQQPETIRCQQKVRRVVPSCGHTVDVECYGMVNVPILAGGSSPPALTSVSRLVIAMIKAVRLARNLVKPSAPTRSVASIAASPVRPAQKPVLGPAFTAETARCPARCPAICYLARSGVCAPVDVKESNVDYIMGLTYAEVDLNETPVIVPPCGHMMTVESFDGQMAMTDHYEISGDGIILALKSSEPFSVKSLKNCPMCRASLRNVNRYNRITKRGQIDEATKKFIVWANAEFIPLAENLHEQIKQLHTSEAGLSAGRGPKTDDLRNLFRTGGAPVARGTEDLTIKGTRNDQVHRIRQLEGLNARYQEILKLRRLIQQFLKHVSEAEQPFGRVYDMVQDIRRRRGIETNFPLDSTILQVNSRLRATALLLRCDLAILSDFTKIHRDHYNQSVNAQPHSWMSSPLKLDLACNRKDCLTLISECTDRIQPMHEIEGRIFFARLAALSRSAPADNNDPEAIRRLVSQAKDGLAAARAACNRTASTRSLSGEVGDAETMLKEETFYTEFTNEEMREVYAAMATELRGTGHWYTCENGHPFTIGNCGMPMQTARCSECGVTIGGQNHQAASGVRRAESIEGAFGRLGI